MIDKLIKKRFGILVLLIVALASFLRFYNYFSRFGIAYDQAHDALVARFAVSHFFDSSGRSVFFGSPISNVGNMVLVFNVSNRFV